MSRTRLVPANVRSIVQQHARCIVSEDEDPVPGLVAGLIVWLAEQRLEPDYRHRCPSKVERFLRWQGRLRRQQLPCSLNAYCRELAVQGVPDGELNKIRRTIGDLGKFLRDQQLHEDQTEGTDLRDSYSPADHS